MISLFERKKSLSSQYGLVRKAWSRAGFEPTFLDELDSFNFIHTKMIVIC